MSCVKPEEGLKETERKNWMIIIKIKKAMKHESDGDTRCNWCTWNDSQKALKGVWKSWKSRGQIRSIVKIG